MIAIKPRESKSRSKSEPEKEMSALGKFDEPEIPHTQFDYEPHKLMTLTR